MRRTLLLSLFALTGCSASPDPTAPTSAPTSTGAPSGTSDGSAPDAAQAERLKKIAAEYAGYRKVSPRLEIAPTLCKAPTPPREQHLQRSASTDAWSHGQKLYYLFASDGDAYARDGGREGTKQPDNQVLVKESYVAEEAAYDPKEEMVGEGAKFWKKGARASLFVMARKDGKWEFGTVAATGEIATEGTTTAGCHDCHDKQPDGLFGLKKEP